MKRPTSRITLQLDNLAIRALSVYGKIWQQANPEMTFHEACYDFASQVIICCPPTIDEFRKRCIKYREQKLRSAKVARYNKNVI